MTQVQSNSISGTNVAIIVAAAVVGTAILTTAASCLIVRYRRKKRRDREGLGAAINNNEKQYEKPMAVRGSIGSPSPRFTPFGGGTGYPMDKFKLPDLTLSPFLKRKTNAESPSEIGFARSSFNIRDVGRSPSSDVYGVSPTSFRLQKDSSVKSATSVRLIRVGSTAKGKEKAREEDQKALLSPVLSPAPPLPTQTPSAPTEPVAVGAPPVRQPQPVVPSPPASPVESIAAPPPAATRFIRNSEAREPDVDPVRRTATMSSQNRLRFRDSSDVESAEPSPAGWRLSAARAAAVMNNPMRNTNTASLRIASGVGVTADGTQTSPPRRPKNAGASCTYYVPHAPFFFLSLSIPSLALSQG